MIHHETINTLREKFEIHQDKFKIICFHHQLIPIPNVGRDRSSIDDSGNMLKMLIETKVDLVLNGHRHISNLYKLSSVQKDLYIKNVGTFSCNKTRYREPCTYSIIDIEGNTLNFKILPIFKSAIEKNILRAINYYAPRETKSDEKPFCKFIQICNTLITEKSEKENTNFDKAIEEINKIQDVDLVIHTGNLTKNSYKEEFKIAKSKLSQIKHPYMVIPGYTDSKPPSWQHWEQHIGSLDPLYETDKLYFKSINSTTPDSKIGFIGRQKLRKFIDKVLSLSHQKIFGVCCYHNLIPTPLSVWRTELIDAGDALSQFALSQIDLVLNSSPSISFNVKIENSIFSNGGNLQGEYFDESFNEIDIYKDGLVVLTEYNLKTMVRRIIGKYNIHILT